MKRLNNKGLTLIELIVSISLMSIVMLFLYRMLANITYDSDNEFFASGNQEQRIELTDYIHTKLREYDITKVPEVTKTTNYTTIKITQKNGSKIYSVLIYANYIQIKDSTTILRTWDLEKGMYAFKDVECKNGGAGATGEYYPCVCKIPVYTVNIDNNANNNNTIDDITLSFLIKG